MTDVNGYRLSPSPLIPYLKIMLEMTTSRSQPVSDRGLPQHPGDILENATKA